MFHKLHVVADSLTTNSFIKCCNYEVVTDFVWPLNLHYEKQQHLLIKGGLSGPRPGALHHLSAQIPK